jgi:uncharacterized protein
MNWMTRFHSEIDHLSLTIYNLKAVYRKMFKVLAFLAFLLFGAGGTMAQDIPEPPSPPRLVNDLAGVLSSEEVQTLEDKLVAFNDSASTQIAVVIVPSLNGYEKMDFTYRLAEKWGVGQKGKSNGLVIMVKPKTSLEKGEAFIAPGYGLEAVIPDAICKRIVDNEMIPYFQQGNYYGGIDAATNTIISLAKGEYTADQYAKGKKSSPYALLIPVIIMAVVFLLIRSGRARSHSIGKNIPFWTAFWLLGSMGSGSHSGSWSNFSSGSGGFGGGGGFGGFGGGSFGGGGAGGSW